MKRESNRKNNKTKYEWIVKQLDGVIATCEREFNVNRIQIVTGCRKTIPKTIRQSIEVSLKYKYPNDVSLTNLMKYFNQRHCTFYNSRRKLTTYLGMNYPDVKDIWEKVNKIVDNVEPLNK
jgi:hypothetical protein